MTEVYPILPTPMTFSDWIMSCVKGETIQVVGNEGGFCWLQRESDKQIYVYAEGQDER